MTVTVNLRNFFDISSLKNNFIFKKHYKESKLIFLNSWQRWKHRGKINIFANFIYFCFRFLHAFERLLHSFIIRKMSIKHPGVKMTSWLLLNKFGFVSKMKIWRYIVLLFFIHFLLIFHLFLSFLSHIFLFCLSLCFENFESLFYIVKVSFIKLLSIKLLLIKSKSSFKVRITKSKNWIIFTLL